MKEGYPLFGAWEYEIFGACTPGFGAVAREAAAVEAAERVRTLYVAMTRAVQELAFVTTGGRPAVIA